MLKSFNGAVIIQDFLINKKVEYNTLQEYKIATNSSMKHSNTLAQALKYLSDVCWVTIYTKHQETNDFASCTIYPFTIQKDDKMSKHTLSAK